MIQSNRRAFLQAVAGSLASAGLGSRVLAEQQDSPAGIPTRRLGKTGERVSIIGIGGYHIGAPEEKEAIAILHEAIAAGVTFFDNSWDYRDGASEEAPAVESRAPPRRLRLLVGTEDAFTSRRAPATPAARRRSTAPSWCCRIRVDRHWR